MELLQKENIELQRKIDEVRKINDELTQKIIELNLKIIKSNIAKNGYREEELICNDFNNNKLLINELKKYINKDIGVFKKINGNHKIDISDTYQNTFQIKKYKNKQFGQIDRHWINDIVKFIPGLKCIQNILTDWCEIPLQNCGKIIDKEKQRKLLSTKYYTQEELDYLINVLDKNKVQILNFIFKGSNNDYTPTYICGIEYNNNIRTKIIIYKIDDIIEYLSKEKFFIKSRKTVIGLGSCISLQRKGGDGGKKSSNQLQFKLIFSSINIKNILQYKL